MISFKILLSTYFQKLVNKLSHRCQQIRTEIRRTECVFCRSPTSSRRQLCRPCRTDLQLLTLNEHNACDCCALPLTQIEELSPPPLRCGECIQTPPTYERTIAAYQYIYPIDGVIHHLKYRRRRDLCLPLTQQLAQEIERRYINDCLPSALIPVPMPIDRERARGYNQAMLIALALTQVIHIPILRNAVSRRRATHVQSQLNRQQRKKNLRHAFKVEDGYLPEHIAIVDDVVTTTATVESLSKKLQEAGIKRIDVWCVARTPKMK